MNIARITLHGAAASLLLFQGVSSAQEPAQVADELRAMRQTIDAQNKQIESLRQAISQLSERLQGAAQTNAPAPVTSAAPSDAPSPNAPPPTPPAVPSGGEIPRAEVVNPSVQHTVAKGETLTSIAKQYKLPIAELHKANKITDDRKLQIGQVLNIPAPKAETPTEKKENP